MILQEFGCFVKMDKFRRIFGQGDKIPIVAGTLIFYKPNR